MTKKLLLNSDTTYIFDHPNFYNDFAGKPCKVVNWNPPNLYTMEYEDGTRIVETENYLRECLSLQTKPIEFKLGDEVQSELPRDNYLDSFSCGKIGTIIEINSQNNPKKYLVKFSSYSDYGDEDYHQWVSASEIKKTQESKIPDMTLILTEGMVVKVAGTDANHIVIHSEPYLSNLNTDHDLCLLNVETLEPLAIGDRQILKVWDTNRKLVYDANDAIIASLKRQAETILVKIKELEATKVL